MRFCLGDLGLNETLSQRERGKKGRVRGKDEEERGEKRGKNMKRKDAKQEPKTTSLKLLPDLMWFCCGKTSSGLM